MKKYQAIILVILLLIILVSSCNEVDIDVVTKVVVPAELIPTFPANTKVPVLPTATEAVYEIEYQVELPQLFQAAFNQQLISASNPLVMGDCTADGRVLWWGSYVFSAAAQFPTVIDDVEFNDLLLLWQGETSEEFPFGEILIPDMFKSFFMSQWGNPENEVVTFLPMGEIEEVLWETPSSIALVPFDDINPRMKVLSISDQNPMRNIFDVNKYPLAFDFCLTIDGDNDETAIISKLEQIPITNRDQEKLTSVLMTGVTALTRDIAYKMELNGVLYPAEEIMPWFEEADLVHISNEVPFTEECPVPEPPLSGSRFCSRVEYFNLLSEIGVDVMELTGNHLYDYGADALQETLALFDEAELPYFGGGKDLTDANQPLLLEHHGNRIAFVGCNVPGPDSVFATSASPGANPCDIDALVERIHQLTADDYLVIAGVQHYEACQIQPMSAQREDMQLLAEAGAVIVSGSQSHCPQGITFVEGNYIHYGLGNLFFDQMWDAYRNAFLDYHVFYDGEYLGVQLLTTRLEDAAQPRPMTAEERSVFLNDIFLYSDWGNE